MTRLALCLVALLAIAACTETAPLPKPEGKTIEAPPDTKVVGVTWLDQDVWIIVRPMLDSETPEQWQFQRSAASGPPNVTVTIRESRTDPDFSGLVLERTRE